MKKNLLFILFLMFGCTSLSATVASVEKKIKLNKKILTQKKSQKKKTDIKLKLLAKQINKQSRTLSDIENQIEKIDKKIQEHKHTLIDAKKELKLLQTTTKELTEQIKSTEKEIVEVIIDEFSSSLALKLASKSTMDELIDNEIFTILSNSSKENVTRLNSNYIILTQNKEVNQKKIKKLQKYIKKSQQSKKKLTSLKTSQQKAIASLERKHTNYQKELKKIVKKQTALSNLLSNLNILKRKEKKKEKKAKELALKKRLAALKRKKELEKKRKRSLKKTETKKKKTTVKRFAKNIDIDVRKIGSSTSGVKITKYRGKKTIAPLKSYKIVKKFGKYYDPVYKIELFNESIILKSKKSNAKVYNVLNGKIVYAKKNAGMLENVVIVRHSNGLHTIYSHLDKISPTLRVGKWVKKGYVVGRVNESLTFQATKNNYYVNPKDLFR